MLRTGLLSIPCTAGLLLTVLACGKQRDEKIAAVDAVVPVGVRALDLSSRPQLLFQVFGERDDPRLLPLAAVVNGVIRPIGLTPRGWRQLDSTYFSAGTKYTIYRDDAEFGEVEVSAVRPSVPIPGCTIVKPIAAGKLTFKEPRSDQTVEFIATSAPLPAHPSFKGKLPTEAEVGVIGRAFGYAIGKQAGMGAAELDSLDFHARMMVTGATSEPTLLVSFIDPGAGDLGPGAGHTSHLFALGDRTLANYEPTYRHAVSGDAKTVEFQRVLDHLDVTGDGVDEIFLETWHYGAENDLAVLSFKAGRWHEVMRVRQSWCLDAPRDKR